MMDLAPVQPNADVLLETRDLSVFHGRVDAVRNVNMTVGRGQIVTIIGANGAGKSTLLGGLMRLLTVTGTVRYFGQTFGEEVLAEQLVARGMTLIPESRELFSTMSVEDNLILGAFARYRAGDRAYRDKLEEVYEIMPRLKERRTQKAATLSGGERQMLAMGRALMSKPQILLLDEPSLGLAPLIIRDVLRTVSDLRDRGVSCLLVEQNARAALGIADYAYVMESGSIVMEGPAEEIAKDPGVISSYLGVGSGRN